MFDTLIVQPILNLLFAINSLLPGHDFGVSIIIFTIVIRFLLWPLVKKQLHQSRAMRALQPEMKKIKEKTKGDKQKEGKLLMELYKERNVSPFGTIGILLLQLPVLFGLFIVLRILSEDPERAVNMLYGFVKDMSGVPELVADATLITQALTESFWGSIDLSQNAFGNGFIYWPLMAIAVLAGVLQFFQSKQLMPDIKDSKSLRDILKEEASGKKSEQKDISAAVGKNMLYFMPFITVFFAATFPGALALYWATGAGVAILQHSYILSKDVDEMAQLADKNKPQNSTKKPKKKIPKKGQTEKKTSSSPKKKKG